MSALKYQVAFEQSQSLLLMLDTNFTIVAVSDAYLSTAQMAREAMIGRYLFDIFPDNPDDLISKGERKVRASINRVIQTKKADTLALIKYDIPKPASAGGGYIMKYWRTCHFPILDETKNVAYIMQQVEDVTANETLAVQLETDQKLLREVRDSEKRYNILLMKSPFGLAVFKGEQMVITLANDRIKKIWGKGNTAEGKPFFDVFPEFKETQLPDLLNKVYTTGIPYYGSEILCSFEREVSYFNFIYQPYLEADETISGVAVIVYDVTEMVLARKKIEESKLRFQCAIAAVQGVLWTNNALGEMEEIQPGWELLTGQSKKQYQGYGWINAIHSEDKSAMLNAWKKAVKAKENFSFEHRLKRCDGSWGHFSVNAIPLFNPDGSVLEWVGVHIDISRQRMAEEAVKESEQRYKRLVDAMPQKIINSDASGNVNFFNQQWVDETGFSFEELLNNGWVQTVHPDDRVNIETNWKSAVNSGNVFDIECRIINKQEEYRWNLNRAVPLKNKNGIIVMWVGSSTDIHEQKEQKTLLEKAVTERTKALDDANKILIVKNEEQVSREKKLIILSDNLKDQQAEVNKANLLLRIQEEEVKVINQQLSLLNQDLEERVKRRTKDLAESENRFRTMMETIPQIAWTNTVDLEVNFYNEGWYDYTGLDFTQSKGSGWQKVVHPDDLKNTLHSFIAIIQCMQGGGFQLRLQNIDTEYRWHLIRLMPIKDEEDKINLWVGTATDIHDLKLLQQQKDDFINIASHELKTPVTSLKLSLQILNELKESLSQPLVANLISQANRSLNKFTILIDDLLDASKANEGQLHLNKKFINLSQVIGDCCTHVQLVGKYNLKFEGDKDIQVYADPKRIDQIIVNLVNNAMKYAPDSKEIIIYIKKLKDRVRISVMDKGPGIAPEKLPHLFERYYQVEDYKTEYLSGLGLGLYIAAEIVKMHRGEIGVDSEIGKGCSFWFTLPLL